MESDITKSIQNSVERESSVSGTEPELAENELDIPISDTMVSSMQESGHLMSESITTGSGDIEPLETGILRDEKHEAESKIDALVVKSSSFIKGIVPTAKEYFSEKEHIKQAASRAGAVAVVGGIGALAFNKAKQPQQRKVIRLKK